MKRFWKDAAVVLAVLVVAFPILWIFASSVKSDRAITSSPWSVTLHPHWNNYQRAWNSMSIGTALMNSAIATVGSIVILIPIGAMASYVLARYRFFGNKFLTGMFLTGMMFPNFLVVVPLFMLLNSMHLVDSLPGLILAYVSYSLSFTIFVLGGFFQVLPYELSEAAMLDGCTHAGIFWKIMMPLARPGIVVVAIFDAIGLWNEYPLAMVLLTRTEKQTLPIGIANLAMAQQYQSDWGAMFAGLTIVTIPVLVVYWIFRDRIHETMLAGAVKG